MIYHIFHLGIIGITGVFVGYQLVLGLSAFLYKPVRQTKSDYNRTFLIVIPCLNDDQFISKTLYSLSGLAYPLNFYKLIVVADSGSGRVAKTAERMGVQVVDWPRNDKGVIVYSVSQALDHIEQWEATFDAVICISPDSLVSANFLEVMNGYLTSGNEVIQSSHLAASKPKGFRKYWQLNLLLFNYINSLGRKKFGFDVKLAGNGMCFAVKLLKLHSLKLEEMVSGRDRLCLASRGIPVTFAPEAQVWSPVSNLWITNLSGSKHWKNFQIAKNHLSILLKKSKPMRLIDNIMKLINPPLPLITLFMIIMLALDRALFILKITPVSYTSSWLILISLTGVYFFIVFFKTRNTYLGVRQKAGRQAFIGVVH